MSETWRRKTYYDKRVLIAVSDIIEPIADDTIICLTGAQIVMLRNLTQYLHRRSTFVDVYHDTCYLAPTNEQWDTLDAIVADLEDKLMGCDIDTLVDAIEQQTAELATLRQCVCTLSNAMVRENAELPSIDPWVDEGLIDIHPPDESYAPAVPSPDDEERCEYAQAIWYYVYQMFTEDLLPVAQGTADAIMAAIVATSTFAGIATFVGIPVAVLAVIAYALVAWAVSGSIDNFVNWMLGTKDDLICEIYKSLPNIQAATIAAKAYIDDAEELSYLDKVLLKSVFGSVWHYTYVIKDQYDNGTWDSYFIPGQCADCEPLPDNCQSVIPCDLGDWDVYQAGDIECHGSYPRCVGGWGIYTETAITQPSDTFWLKIWYCPRGEDPTAQADFDCRIGDNQEIQIPLYPDSAKPVDIWTSVTYQITSYTTGQKVSIQAIQYGWYFDISHFCVYDYDPDA